MVNKIALEFAQYVLQQNPKAKSFVAMYDAMSRVAAFRSFRNLGPEELARIGISFSLLATEKLERVIEEARKALSGQNDKTVKGIRSLVVYDMGARETLSSALRHETFSSPREIFEFRPETQPEGTNVQPNGVPLLPLTIQAQEANYFIAE